MPVVRPAQAARTTALRCRAQPPARWVLPEHQSLPSPTRARPPALLELAPVRKPRDRPDVPAWY
ncbi:MAG: hypothetical protein ACRDJE_23505, partial [Dehalococcoidia bacterium]